MPATPKTSGSHVYNDCSAPPASVPQQFLPRQLALDMSPKSVPTPAHPSIGTLIDNDNLQLVEILGVGGYGVVYRAVDTHASFPKSYAVKCLVDPIPKQNGRQRQVHIREITLHQLVSAHPHVVTLHRVIEDYNHTYIVMDYASDGDLFSQILYSCRYLGDDYLIKKVFLQLLDAVEYCHSLGIYHRDLKPENVLCFSGGLQVAITDFGLATTDRVSEEFRTGSVYHMSPECQGGVFAPTGSYSPMFNDIWSLAIILLNLATGRNPWKSASASDPTFQAYMQDPQNFLPTVLPISPQVNAILVRMLDVDWRKRMTLPEVRRAIQGLDHFYSEGVVFEGSMARCPWEAGMDIDSDTSTKEDSHCEAVDEFRSHWSKDSISDSDVDFANQSLADELMYTRWGGYSLSAAAWARGSSASSTDSQCLLEDLKLWESPRTPPICHSPESSSLGSLPVTPNSGDATFGDRVSIAPPKTLTLDTDCGRGHYRSQSVASYSTGSSMMQTALDLEPYSSSFFLASPGPRSKTSLEIPPTLDLEDEDDEDDAGDQEHQDMDTTSSHWEYAVSEMSYSSTYTRTRSLLSNDLVDEIRTIPSPCSDTVVWPEYRVQPKYTTAPSRPIPIPSSTARPETRDSLPPSPPSPKKSPESKSKGAGIFKFFPRSPGSSSSFSGISTFSRSRTPSPSPKQPWAFVPSRAKTPVQIGTQDENCQSTAARVATKRHWFSPGKLFAANAS